MSKTYETDTDPALVELCLNCTREKCSGVCDALREEKRRLAREKKEKSRGGSPSRQN